MNKYTVTLAAAIVAILGAIGFFAVRTAETLKTLPSDEPTQQFGIGVSPEFNLGMDVYAFDSAGNPLPEQSIQVVVMAVTPEQARVHGWDHNTELRLNQLEITDAAPFWSATEAHSYSLLIKPWQVGRNASQEPITIECHGFLDGTEYPVEQTMDDGYTICTVTRT